MGRVKFIEHKGKKILFLDFLGMKLNEYMEGIKKAEKIVKNQPKKHTPYAHRYNGNNYMPAGNKTINDSFRDNTPYVKASAAIGITGIKRILVRTMEKYAGREIYIFNNLPEAKDWLAGR